MLIPFQGQVTKRDLTRIFNLATKGQRWLAFVFSPLCLIFAALVVINYEHASSYFYVMVMTIFGLMATYPLWGSLSYASNTYRQVEMRGTFEGTFSEDEVLLRTVNTMQNLKWAVYKKVVRNQEIVLLYQGSRCFNFFPRKFFRF